MSASGAWRSGGGGGGRASTRKSYLSGTRVRGGRGQKGNVDEHTHAGGFREGVTTYPSAWRAGERNTVYAVDGSEYTGAWKEDLRHGEGVEIWANGDRYEGEWEEDMRQGRGSFWRMLEGGELFLEYSGGWLADARHGLGSGHWPNGDVYEGEWAEGRRAGWGSMYYASGERYEGEWADDMRSGFGKLFLTNGNVYEGSWDFDVKDGPGRLYFVAKNKLYEGEWLNDEAKCGVFVDIELSDDPALSKYGIPRLGITNETASHIIQERIDHIQAMRDKLALIREEAKIKEEERKLAEAKEAAAARRRIGAAGAMRSSSMKRQWR